MIRLSQLYVRGKPRDAFAQEANASCYMGRRAWLGHAANRSRNKATFAAGVMRRQCERRNCDHESPNMGSTWLSFILIGQRGRVSRV